MAIYFQALDILHSEPPYPMPDLALAEWFASKAQQLQVIADSDSPYADEARALAQHASSMADETYRKAEQR